MWNVVSTSHSFKAERKKGKVPGDANAIRYSYVRNHPLKYTDPSGHSWLSKIFKMIVVAVIAFYTAEAVLGALGHSFSSAVAGWISGIGVSGTTTLIASGAAAGFVAGMAGGLSQAGSL